MSQPTLTYFDAPASRGEECRLALFVAGVPFTDERLKPPQWAERKASTPYGQLPTFAMEGKPTLAQSNAILRMIGSQHGLLPADPWESARHEGVLCAVEDMRAALTPSGRLKDPEQKKAAREALAKDYFPDWCAHVEKQIHGPFVGGEKLSVADLKVYVAMTPLLAGKIDHVPPATFAPFSKLNALYAAVKAHPKVVEWQSRR